MRVLYVALVVALIPASLSGSSCIPGLLSTYTALGSTGCDLGPFTVKDFTFALISSSIPVAAADINVTPVSGGENFGIQFSSSALTVSGTDFAKFLIAYTWDPGDIRSMDDVLNDPVVPPGFAGVTTDICVDSPFRQGFCPLTTVTLSVFDDGIAPHLFDSVTFSPPAGTLGIRNTFDLEARGATADILDLTNRLQTQAPEPSTIMGGLCAVGLLAAARRRRLRQARDSVE